MQRSVEDDQINLLLDKRQPIEFSLHGREDRIVMKVRAEAVERVGEQIHGGDDMPTQRQAIGKPAVPCAEIDQAQWSLLLLFHRQQHLTLKRAETASADVPVGCK